ncbi:MAG: c-type cytochrome [Stellaceae bacterium]
MRTHWRAAGFSLALALVVGFAVTVSAAGQSKLEVVKHRQATMKQQAADLKYIATYAKGGGGTEAGAGYKVDDLETVSGEILALFVPGTSTADLPGKTYAKPNIWTDWKKFSAQIPHVQDLEAGLGAAVKKNNKPEILAAIGNLGKNGCGACHSDYRAKMPRH